MINYKNQTLIWGSSLVFSIALLTTVFNATNPEFNFPGITETLLIGVSLLLVANSLFTGKSLTRREWILGGILFFLIGTLTIRYFLSWNDEETIPSRRCIWMPGYFDKLECFLQLPFKSNHGLRQLLFHFTALSVFMGVACLSRMSGALRHWLLIPLAIPALIVVIGVMIPIYYDPNFSLTGYNFVYSEHSFFRAKGVIANPSWLWPWLTPLMVMSSATLFAKNWILKGIGLTFLCVCVWASISVMQRGGYLIVGVLIVTTILTVLYLAAKNISKKFAWAVMGAGCLIMCYLVYNSKMIIKAHAFFEGIGLHLRGSLLQSAQKRLKIWEIAWQGSIQENVWVGKGYGSWLSEFSKLKGSTHDGFFIYDTAHNLWIQLIFELGLIHVFFILIIFSLIVWTTMIHKNSDQLSIKIGGFFLIIGFFVASIVQEIDYILPVYLQFATFAGLCFGGTSYPESLEKISSSKQLNVLIKNGTQKSKTNNLAWSMVGISILGVLGSFYYASTISWGGSSFEPTQQAFNRWFRPKGVIAATPDSRKKEYSIFWSEHGQFEKESFITLKNFPEIWIQGNAIYLKNGSKWNPNQFWYESKKHIYHEQRLVSFALHQPHGQTNSILLAENGMYSWEFGGIDEDGVKVGRWCKKQCNFLLYYPNVKNQPHGIKLQMPLPGLDDSRPVRLFIKIQSISDEITPYLSEKKIQQMIKKTFSKDSSSKELTFNNPEEIHLLPIELHHHQLWLISLKTDRTIIPSEHDQNSNDRRGLGVRVLF